MVDPSIAYDSSRRASAIHIWRYRSLLRNLVARAIKVRHKRSSLGVLWAVLNPLITTLILAVVFSKFFGMRLKAGGFAAYVLSGLTIWNLFSQASASGLASIHASATIIRQVYVPKAVFPVAAVASSFVDFVFASLALLVFLLVSKTPLRWPMALTVLPVAELTGFTLGISMILATLYVYFHDVRWFYESALLAWFYASPIFYPPEIIGGKYASFLHLNPMWPILSAFRRPIIEGQPPHLADLAWGGAAAALALGLGSLVLKRYEANMVNYL